LPLLVCSRRESFPLTLIPKEHHIVERDKQPPLQAVRIITPLQLSVTELIPW
jgi:hypothetical protein